MDISSENKKLVFLWLTLIAVMFFLYTGLSSAEETEVIPGKQQKQPEGKPFNPYEVHSKSDAKDQFPAATVIDETAPAGNVQRYGVQRPQRVEIDKNLNTGR